LRLVAVFGDCPQFAERGYTSFFKPFYVQVHLDERIRAHPPATFSRTTRQFHSIPFDPELDQHSPPHTRDFPVLPEAETNSAAYPTNQVPGVLVEEAEKAALFEWSDPALFLVDQKTLFRHATSGFTSTLN